MLLCWNTIWYLCAKERQYYWRAGLLAIIFHALSTYEVTEYQIQGIEEFPNDNFLICRHGRRSWTFLR